MLCAATFAVPASQAITDGELDGNGHPTVGLMVADERSAACRSGAAAARCVTPTVVRHRRPLHGAPGGHVEIWFDDGSDVPIGDPGNATRAIRSRGDVGGTPCTHPDYNPNAFFLRDLGVVELDASVERPYWLRRSAGLNSLDALATKRGQQET